jgi:hypothetical protein
MKTKSCNKMLGNALMNDAWFRQKVDPAKKRQLALIFQVVSGERFCPAM